jgi:hypothetical protein
LNSSKIERYKILIQRLAEPRKEVLKEIIHLCRKIAIRSKVNLMNADNLGIVWGPNILRPLVETHGSILETPVICLIITELIVNDVFDEVCL